MNTRVAELALRHHRGIARVIGPLVLLAGVVLTAPTASAQGFFDFLFGDSQPQKPQRSAPASGFFGDPLGNNASDAPPPQRSASSGGAGPAFCVRTCDGKYFPLGRSASPVQMCQAFCPAATTKVFYGSAIDGASSSTGERYAEIDNAFAYRKALRADCTCNGRDPAGLAPIDLTLDTSLRPGDVIATTSGLVAFSGVRTGNGQTAEFTPVASYPGLTSDVRARLGEMKVAPAAADMVAEEAPMPAAATTVVPKSAPVANPARAKRADAN
jgi:hypothetical protein